MHLPPTPLPPPVVSRVMSHYTYDKLYRLVAVDYSDGRYFHYTYDAVGNRLSEEKCALLPCGTPITNTYTYDAANRLASVNGQAYTSDDNPHPRRFGDFAATCSVTARTPTPTMPPTS